MRTANVTIKKLLAGTNIQKLVKKNVTKCLQQSLNALNANMWLRK